MKSLKKIFSGCAMVYFGAFLIALVIGIFSAFSSMADEEKTPIVANVVSANQPIEEVDVPEVTHSGTCMGVTKKGKPCRNKASKGSRYCWRHGG